MLHEDRIWCVQSVESPMDLARMLTECTMCCCCAFELSGYLFLNDSTSPDGAQEYAVVRKTSEPDSPFVQIESVTFGWCDADKGLHYVEETLAGQYDQSEFMRPVHPILQTLGEHGRCGFCA